MCCQRRTAAGACGLSLTPADCGSRGGTACHTVRMLCQPVGLKQCNPIRVQASSLSSSSSSPKHVEQSMHKTQTLPGLNRPPSNQTLLSAGDGTWTPERAASDSIVMLTRSSFPQMSLGKQMSVRSHGTHHLHGDLYIAQGQGFCAAGA